MEPEKVTGQVKHAFQAQEKFVSLKAIKIKFQCTNLKLFLIYDMNENRNL